MTMKEMSIVQKAGRMNPSLMIPIDARLQFVKQIVFMGCVQAPIFARVKLDGKNPNQFSQICRNFFVSKQLDYLVIILSSFTI